MNTITNIQSSKSEPIEPIEILDSIDTYYNFIYLFKSPTKDSTMVTIDDMIKIYNISIFKEKPITQISDLPFNEENFYQKMGEIVKTSYVEEVENENKINTEINKIIYLLKENYLIK